MDEEYTVALRCILICLDHGAQTAAYQIQEEFRVSSQDVANMTLGEGRLMLSDAARSTQEGGCFYNPRQYARQT